MEKPPWNAVIASTSQDQRLYKQVRELGRQVDEAVAQAKELPQLFTSDLSLLRRRLRDKCEQLLMCQGSIHRRKTEDLLWTKVFYQVLAQCRTARKMWIASDVVGQAYLRHLATAITFYQSLIQRLEKHYGQSFTDVQPTDVDAEDDDTQWLKESCYRCLVHMGDSARYQNELCPSSTNPVYFYHKAIALDPTNGTTFNQLAALAGDKNEGLDAAYYYWRSLSSPRPFKGAEVNLKKVLDRVSAQYEWAESAVVTEIKMRAFIKKRFLIRFLKLQMMLTTSDLRLEQAELALLSERVIEDLQECLDMDLDLYQEGNPVVSVEPSVDSSPLLQCDVILKLSATVILTAHSLRIKGSRLTAPATALALSLCSQLLLCCSQRLRVAMRGRGTQAPPPEPHQTMLDYMGRPEVARQLGEGGEDPVAKAARRKSKLKVVDRRRRTKGGVSRKKSFLSESDESSCEDVPGGGSSDEISDFDDLGEDEEQLLQELSTSDDSDGGGHAPRRTGGRGRRQNITLAAAFTNFVPKAKGKAPPAAPAHLLQECLQLAADEQVLMVARVYGDWLQANPVVIATCSQSCELLWTRLADLLNMLPSEAQLTEAGYATPLELAHPPALVEDEVIRGFAPLVRSQEHINYSVNSGSPIEQAALRIFCLHGFGRFVANAKTAPQFSFDLSSQKYAGPGQLARRQAGVKERDSRKQQEEAKQKQSKLMKTMAKHRLELEVADLSKQKASQPGLVTPFVLPDADTLCSHLHILQKLLRKRQFVIVIARSVLDVLDQMKRESYSAREAIKFLEREFQTKNKFLRPQAPSETADPHSQRAANQDLELWHFQRLVSCAVYFTRASLDVTLKTCSATLLLDSGSTQEKFQLLIEQARGQEVDIYSPHAFYKLCMQQSN